jgi:hypothetical protein
MLDHLIDEDVVFAASLKIVAIETAEKAYKFLRQRKDDLPPDVVDQITRLMEMIDELVEGDRL